MVHSIEHVEKSMQRTAGREVRNLPGAAEKNSPWPYLLVSVLAREVHFCVVSLQQRVVATQCQLAAPRDDEVIFSYFS